MLIPCYSKYKKESFVQYKCHIKQNIELLNNNKILYNERKY